VRLDPKLKERAKHMRANPTPPELKLWLALRANRFESQQFTRQTIIAPISSISHRRPQNWSLRSMGIHIPTIRAMTRIGRNFLSHWDIG
jgi:hypothetical protein